MSYIKKIAFLCFSLVFLGCSVNREASSSVKQGVFGTVTWLEGNMMPSPDRPKTEGARPVVREIKIYEAVSANQVQGESPLYTAVNGKLITTVKSNAKGFFRCELPAGSYSIFTVEDDGRLFANSFDGKGMINAFNVIQGEAVRMDIQINYRAAF